MALINQTQREYYEGPDGVQNSGDKVYGNYQFVSLEDIINQFMVIYVGEDKLITKARKTDIQFHGMRALQELSFDTFKSYKSIEMDVPATLQLPLPIDYVNYTALSFIDDAGVKRGLQPLSKTSNPIAYQQNEDGSFKLESNSYIRNFRVGGNIVETGETETRTKIDPNTGEVITVTVNVTEISDIIPPTNEYQEYGITQSGKTSSASGTGNIKSDNLLPKFVKETRIAITNASGYNNTELAYGPGSAMQMNFFTADHDIEVGMTIFAPGIPPNTTVASVGDSTSSDYPGMGITMTNPDYENFLLNESGSNGYPQSTQILGEEVIFVDLNKQSKTWSNYKAHTPQTNMHNDYEDDHRFYAEGRRYGIDPQYAQDNGSYYIDSNTGLIHFSSFISGKTIVLDYLSDSLGTEAEMQVHKFAEEAMYKHIAHAILAGKRNIPEYIVNRLKKEKFAETRKAKLRLSNLKLEELTQILRGKSKWIKH